MLLVQEFLETHTFKELEDAYGVGASFDKNGLSFSLNYDQLESKESDLLSQQCRGLILCSENGNSFKNQAILNDFKKLDYSHICPGKTKILSYPFQRFFNSGQGAAANIDWSSIKAFSKADGTLTIVYYSPFTNLWNVSTRSVPEADVQLDCGKYTFRTLFEKALNDRHNLSFDDFTTNLNKDICYMFELVSPYNRVVVNYPQTDLFFLGARNLLTLKELDIDDQVFKDLPIKRVGVFDLKSLDDIINWVSAQNPLEHEGIVIRDSHFNRLKCKNAAYVAYSKARDRLGSSDRNCLELILLEKDDDILQFLPQEIVDNLLVIKENVRKTIHKHDEIYNEMKSQADSILFEDKKTFAKLITKVPGLWTAPLFNIYDKKSLNMKDFILKSKKEGTWSNSFLDKILEISNG